MSQTNDELVFLADCHSDIDAKIIKGILESHDIFCFIQGENHHQMLGVIGSYIQMRIMVPESLLEKAKAVLDASEISLPQVDSETLPNSEKTQLTALEPTKPTTLEDLKKRRNAAALLSIFITFGTGHLVIGAYISFVLIGAAEVFCILAAYGKLDHSWSGDSRFISATMILMLSDLIVSQIRMALKIRQFKKTKLTIELTLQAVH